MAGHSRLKNGVAWLAYVPAIHVFAAAKKDVDARHNAGHDEGGEARRSHAGALSSSANRSFRSSGLVNMRRPPSSRFGHISFGRSQ
jgi:hypothetical protein